MNYNKVLSKKREERRKKELKLKRQQQRRKLAVTATMGVVGALAVTAGVSNVSNNLRTQVNEDIKSLITYVTVDVCDDLTFTATISPNKVEIVKSSIEEKKVSLEKKKTLESLKIKGFPEYTNEVYLLAQIITCEAGNNFEDKCYVGSVIINRARTSYRDFNTVNTINEVLLQGYESPGPQQYFTGTIKDVLSGIEPSEEAMKVAQGLISGEIPCLEESTLIQDTTWRPWMEGKVEGVELENSCQFYGRPLDFEEGCEE